jgi:hypothetical protein
VQSSTLALRLSTSNSPTPLTGAAGPMPSTEPSQGIGWGDVALVRSQICWTLDARSFPARPGARFIDHDRVVDVEIQQHHMLQFYRMQESQPPTNLKGHSDDDG